MASVGQRVPAWKRLGLKLKEPGTSSSPSANVNVNADSVTPSRKRKEPPSSSLASSEAPSKQRKSVSFESKVLAAPDGTPKQKANKKTRKATKKAQKKKKKLAMGAKEEAALPNMQRSLEYLSLWQTSRETWRFNKNCQRLILKYVFLGTDSIPTSHMTAFYDYIRDLMGDSRRRLREEAAEICKTDAAKAKEQSEEQDKASKKDKSEPVANVAEYVRVLDECVAARGGAFFSGDAPTRIDEAEFLPRLEDASLKKRLAQRIRAENIVHELDSSRADSAGNEADAAKGTTATKQGGEQKSVEERKKPSDEPPEKKKKSVRSSKKRTMVDSDSDSSSDDSDSDSDSDDSSD